MGIRNLPNLQATALAVEGGLDIGLAGLVKKITGPVSPEKE